MNIGLNNNFALEFVWNVLFYLFVCFFIVFKCSARFVIRKKLLNLLYFIMTFFATKFKYRVNTVYHDKSISN